MSETPPTSSPPPGRMISYRVPEATENEPPRLSNRVVVSGATDALIFEFLYTSEGARLRAFRGEFGGSVAEGPNGTSLVTAEPIARVAVPISVALDMVVDMVRVAVEEAPGIKERFEEAVAEIQGVVSASAFVKKQP